MLFSMQDKKLYGNILQSMYVYCHIVNMYNFIYSIINLYAFKNIMYYNILVNTYVLNNNRFFTTCNHSSRYVCFGNITNNCVNNFYIFTTFQFGMLLT